MKMFKTSISLPIFLSLIFLSCAIVVGQTPPATMPHEKPAAKPPEKPDQPRPSSPDFPGAGLFNDKPPFLVGVVMNRPDMLYHEGETLSAQFTAEKDAYLYLIYHQADGQSLLMFPNEAKKDNRIPAGKTVTIPPAMQDFRFRVGPPLGAEVFQVVASLKPLEELDGLVKKTGQTAVIPRELLDKLRERLLKDTASWTEHRVPIRTVAKETPPPERKPMRVGLFIGVNEYQNEKTCKPFDQLRRNAEGMAKAFTERGKIDAEHSKLITGKEATRANIEEAIVQWLPSVSQPGDTVFIFYTGHGMTLKNVDGTKPDGRDGVLTTYDNDIGSGITSREEAEGLLRSRLITDDALARWLQELSGRQIVLMLESCYSGGMIDAATLNKFFAREAARVKGISQLNVVVIAGCSSDETVRTYTNEPFSQMPRWIIDAMSRLPTPVTTRQAFEHYRQGAGQWMREKNMIGIMEPIMTDSALLPIMLVP